MKIGEKFLTNYDLWCLDLGYGLQPDWDDLKKLPEEEHDNWIHINELYHDFELRGMNSMECFIYFVESYMREIEFKQKPGRPLAITFEFSTSAESLAEKHKYIYEASKRIERGRWEIGYCETCFGYNEEAPFHVEVVWHGQNELY